MVKSKLFVRILCLFLAAVFVISMMGAAFTTLF